MDDDNIVLGNERLVYDRTSFDICGKMMGKTDFETRLCIDIERTAYSINSLLQIPYEENVHAEIKYMVDKLYDIKFKFMINPICFILGYKLFRAKQTDEGDYTNLYAKMYELILDRSFDDKSITIPDIIRYFRLWENYN